MRTNAALTTDADPTDAISLSKLYDLIQSSLPAGWCCSWIHNRTRRTTGKHEQHLQQLQWYRHQDHLRSCQHVQHANEDGEPNQLFVQVWRSGLWCHITGEDCHPKSLYCLRIVIACCCCHGIPAPAKCCLEGLVLSFRYCYMGCLVWLHCHFNADDHVILLQLHCPLNADNHIVFHSLLAVCSVSSYPCCRVEPRMLVRLCAAGRLM